MTRSWCSMARPGTPRCSVPRTRLSSSVWNFARHYELRTEPDISSGPVWITPSIVPESDRHALELDVQWVEFGPDQDQTARLDVIELLRLEFPVDSRVATWSSSR